MSRKPLAGIDPAALKQALTPIARALPSALPAAAELQTAEDFAAVIGRLWQESHDRFVQIGETLEQAKQRLPHGAFITMIDERLPFGRGVAFQLMAAARAVKAGLIPADRAPPSYSTLYLITTLTEEERARALADGVIHPAMRRSDLLAFKRRERQAVSAGRLALEQERARLLRRLAEIEAVLAAPAAEEAEEAEGLHGEILDAAPDGPATHGAEGR